MKLPIEDFTPPGDDAASTDGQSKAQSAIEAVANLVVGFAVSVAITAIVMPAFGHAITFSQNLAMTCIFTVASLLRSYGLRRFFNQYQRGQNENTR